METLLGLALITVLIVVPIFILVKLNTLAKAHNKLAEAYSIRWISPTDFKRLVESEPGSVVFRENVFSQHERPVWEYFTIYRGYRIGTQTPIDMSLSEKCELIIVRSDKTSE